jgi:putative transposase
VAGLEPRSRATRTHPNQTPDEIVEAILRAKRKHPTWGPRKLRPLQADAESISLEDWPPPSTIGDILKRHDLVMPHRRRHHSPPYSQPLAAARASNDVWCIDFKGWFRTADGRRCDPFTVTDAYSRMALGCDITLPRTDEVMWLLDRAFCTYGLPLAIRSDNGPPFASVGAGGLTRVSIQWVKLGIRPERIQPGHPEQNGRHERFHLTLKQETASPPAASAAAQQRRFDAFLLEYNQERPHEALGQQPPASLYRPSSRSYPRPLEEPAYDDEMVVRRVRSNGEIKWAGRLIFIGQPLAGEWVGILDAGIAPEVFYGPILLGQLDVDHRRLVHPPRDAKASHPGAPG